ncbi:MAG: hypothetical protein M1819_002900 [Sarea resinae]|nr:MAG: hypothetical protein M1819_002900 [Sarea resinae]
MCRWFAYISPDEDCLLEDVLVTSKHSICKQVDNHFLPRLISHDPNQITSQHEITARNRLFNIDGLGVAWYTDAREAFSSCEGQRPALFKTAQPPLNDLNFRSIAANSRTKVCFAHIRAASSTPTTAVNNHPFVFGRHSFMHNGFISSFISIRRELSMLMDEDVFANIKGSTDSEHLAGLYMTYLTDGKGKAAWEEIYPTSKMQSALNKAVSTVIELQQKKLGPDGIFASDLNLATTDGLQLLAYRFRNHKTEQPPSLYYSTRAGITLNRKYPGHPDGGENPAAFKDHEEHGKHVIVASEPSTYKEKDWSLIEKNHSVTIQKDGSFEVEAIPYEKSWDAEAEDPSE